MSVKRRYVQILTHDSNTRQRLLLRLTNARHNRHRSPLATLCNYRNLTTKYRNLTTKYRSNLTTKRPPGRSYASAQATKTTLFVAVNEAAICEKSAAGDFFPMN